MDQPCAWELTPDRFECCPDWNTFTAPQQERAVTLASTVVWAATGRRFGLCELVVQPCSRIDRARSYRTYPLRHHSVDDDFRLPSPYILGGVWHNSGSVNCCESWCEAVLAGPTTTDNIVEVQVRGEVVAPSAYVVMDHRILVRTDGECWPCCVNYGQQNPPDFQVTYRRGEPIPEDVLEATAILACEFAQACAGGDCRLPGLLRRMSRQGVDIEVESINRLGPRLMTGIDEVDQVIQTHNPDGLTSRAVVLSPDRPLPRRIT